MFGIGSTEFIVIAVVALLVLGPSRLPELARALGRALAEFRKATADITEEIDNARIMVEQEVRGAAREAEGRKSVRRRDKNDGDDETEDKDDDAD